LVRGEDFVGLDNDEGLSLLQRGRGGGKGRGGKKFGEFYNKLKSKTKLIVSTAAGEMTQPTAGTSTTTKAIEYSSRSTPNLSGNENRFARSRPGSFETSFEYTLENFDAAQASQEQGWKKALSM